MPTFKAQDFTNTQKTISEPIQTQATQAKPKIWHKLVPPIKNRVLREFMKFGFYLLIPITVVYVTSQAAIKEMISLKVCSIKVFHIQQYRYRDPNEKKKPEVTQTEAVIYESSEDTTYFDKKEETKRRVQKYLEHQKAMKGDGEK